MPKDIAWELQKVKHKFKHIWIALSLLIKNAYGGESHGVETLKHLCLEDFE